MITSIQIGDLTIGGFASGFLFSKLSGFGFPEVRVDIQNRGNYHGAVLGMRRYGRRAMTIEGEIIGESAADYEAKRRAIEQALGYNDGLKTVIFNTRSGLAVQADVIVSSAVDLPYQAGKIIRGDFRIEFVAPYPFLEGTVEQTETVYMFSGGGGAIPSALPFSLAVGGSGAEVIANDGNGDAYPVFKIYGAITNPSVTNETTGKSLSIVYDLGVGDYIEVDMYNRTVLLNGSVNILQYVSGDWWALTPGDNEVKLTASANGVDAKTDLIFRDAYLGI
jgi:phage-related protein